ncbi:hypothetical protein ACFL27_15720 [candidate division CSSED10-310 bacterium]|uniref:Glycosyltransferase RgtA/B/C/D-like domain-containing protein n=1 Tax=candidate division CSSED10-310 bacterium TaxID=2855610 RepID=A0ABV6YZY0_UNCC1
MNGIGKDIKGTLDETKDEKNNETKLFLYIFLLMFYIVVILRNSWVGDDAYITLRTVDNFINGYGLRWNVIERVQSYTNPLWMLCVSCVYFLSRNMYFSVMSLSVVISSLTVVIVLFKLSRTLLSAVLAVSILSLSKAFVDFSTSGLENPLTHFLLSLFFIVYFRSEGGVSPEKDKRDIFFLFLIVGLGVFNRMDTILLYAPPAVYYLFQKRVNLKKIGLALSGFSVFIFWELFSLFYYGFPFPNTTYAKLCTGIDGTKLIAQGFYYYINVIIWDPLAIITIISILSYTFFSRPLNKFNFYSVLGICFYLLYILRIGGDFMNGRFFSSLIFIAVVLLCRLDFKLQIYNIIFFIMVIVIGLNMASPTLSVHTSKRGKDMGSLKLENIADNRAVYYDKTSLMKIGKDVTMPNCKQCRAARAMSKSGKKVLVRGMIGYYGYCAGPEMHIIDKCALSDPLLARLPIPDRNKWNYSCYIRQVPPGYEESSISDRNVITNRGLAEYWDKLCIITRGKCFSWTRFVTILYFNLGIYDHLKDDYCTSSPVVVEQSP